MQRNSKRKVAAAIVGALGVTLAVGCGHEGIEQTELQANSQTAANTEVWKGVSVYPHVDLGEGQPCQLTITKNESNEIVRMVLKGTRKVWPDIPGVSDRNVTLEIDIADSPGVNGLDPAEADFTPTSSFRHPGFTRVALLKLTAPWLPGASGDYYIVAKNGYEHVIGKVEDRILGVASSSTAVECKDMKPGQS